MSGAVLGRAVPKRQVVTLPKAKLWWWIALAISLAMLGGGVASVAWLLADGVQVWGNDWPVVWGFEMIAYAWWLGLATGALFVSAVLALTAAVWRPAISRMAETLAVLSVAGAGVYPILHLGRPWFFYWLIPYPNTLQLWPQFKSPLMWDFMSIVTVLFASVSFWLLGMIPDMAALRDRTGPGSLGQFYGILALGFRGSGRQWRHYRAVYAALAGLMIPIVISVQSIGALDFAGGELPGWHSTLLPPLYLFIAGLQGTAAMLVLRGWMGGPPAEWLSRVLLTASLGLAFCYGMEVFSSLTSADLADWRVMQFKFSGPIYWAAIVLNCIVPQVLWFGSVRRLAIPVGLAVLVGTWLEHYVTTIASQSRPELLSTWGHYAPSFWDWSLYGGTIGLAATGMLIATRLLPMDRVWGRA